MQYGMHSYIEPGKRALKASESSSEKLRRQKKLACAFASALHQEGYSAFTSWFRVPSSQDAAVLLFSFFQSMFVALTFERSCSQHDGMMVTQTRVYHHQTNIRIYLACFFCG